MRVPMAMTAKNTRIIKHRGTYSPLKCEHCSLMWYGWYASDEWMGNIVLCTKCYNALINHVYAFGDYDQRKEQPDKYQQIVREWVANKKNKPYPRPPEKQFHSSVPKWMRNAVQSRRVTAGDKLWYVVYSQLDETIKVEITTK